MSNLKLLLNDLSFQLWNQEKIRKIFETCFLLFISKVSLIFYLKKNILRLQMQFNHVQSDLCYRFV